MNTDDDMCDEGTASAPQEEVPFELNDLTQEEANSEDVLIAHTRLRHMIEVTT